MYNLDPAEQTGGRLATQILIWSGVLLLVVGGWLAFPYVSSRVATLPPTLTFAPSPSPLIPILSPTVTNVAPTNAPPLIPELTPTPIPIPTLTPTYPPTPTPALALPTRIVIPSIDVDAPIFPVSLETIDVNGQAYAAWNVLDRYAAGWHETSAPLGVPGNTVLSGHNTTYGEVFRNLYTLDVGDEIVVYSDDNTPYTFAITEVLILPEAGQPLEVRIENARYILPTDNERLTLVTCHPYGSLRNRLIVIAQPSSE